MMEGKSAGSKAGNRKNETLLIFVTKVQHHHQRTGYSRAMYCTGGHSYSAQGPDIPGGGVAGGVAQMKTVLLSFTY